MSQLEVDKIVPQSGTTLTIGDSGDTINFADGQNISIDTNTLYIDSTNNRVGIGTTSPTQKLYVNGHIVGNSLNIPSNTSSPPSGVTIHKPANDIMAFRTASTERMRINSSGNVLVGTTSDSSDTVGIRLKSTGLGAFTVDGGQCITANRLTSDGEIIRLKKDGTTVGSISSNTGSIELDSQGSSLKFSHNGTNVAFLTANNFAPYADNAMDLGYDTGRFKDLYLGGGAYLGGIGTANKLDDYEEGTFTPSFSNSNGFSGLSYTDQNGYYTKIGQLVNVRIRIRLGSGVSKNGNRIIMDGLPFTSANTTGTGNGLYWQYVDDQIIGSNTTNIPILWIANNSSAVNLYKTDGNSFTGNDTSGSTTNMDFYFTGSYTAS